MKIDFAKIDIKTSANIIANLDDTSDEWLLARRKGIGGSDVGKICGLSNYGSPLSVWVDKTGYMEKPKVDNRFTKWGKILEPIIAVEFNNQNVLPDNLRLYNSDALFQSKEYPFMLANIDRLIIDENNTIVSFLECKTASEYRKDEFQESIPDEYMLQIQHYMAVLDVQYCYIAYLIGGSDFGYKRVERDDGVIADMINIERDFWKLVETNTMPEANWNDGNVLNQMFRISNDEILNIPVNDIEKLEVINEFAEKKAELSDLEKKVEELKNRVIQIIGQNLQCNAGRYQIDWKPVNQFDEALVPVDYVEKYKKIVFDKDAFKKENASLYKAYTSPAYRRLTIKETVAK
jgi:putative phage-type endonuclease